MVRRQAAPTRAPKRSMPLASATVLGHFEVLEPLGVGGMGEVYRARDRRLERDVALKVLAPRLLADARSVARFAREARAASALNHPNIVTVYDIGDSSDGAFIAMELVRGETLASRMKSVRSLTECVEVLRQCAAALVAAHDAGIIHRDIKPDNVMVRTDGYVKVLDFGLARLAATDGAIPAVTQPGLLIGTMRYLSPEQACGDPLTTASDIFSLGILAYQLVTGEHPFAGGSDVAIMSGIVTKEAAPPSSKRPEIPPELDALILRMLEKEPADRPTAASLLVQLTRFGATDRAASLTPTGSATLTRSDPTGTALLRAVRPQVAQARRATAVGHGADLEAIAERYDDVVGGHGHFLAVTGEPGIGKTTLIENALAAFSRRDVSPLIARGRCSERLAGAEAYLPILEALDNAASGEHHFAIQALIERHAPSWAALRAVTPDGASGELTRAVASSQERLKREMATLLAEVARRRPLVLLLEDVHWADSSTVDLVSYIGARLDSLPMLLLVSYRDADARASKHPILQVQRELQSKGLASELAVGFLTTQDVREFVDATFPDHRFPPDFARALHVRTEGNPLFLVDVVLWLGSQGVIAEQAGHWCLVRGVPDISRDMPASVRSMIESKIEQLGESERRLLAAAAVQGAEFDTAVAAAVLGADIADVEEQLMTLDRVYAFVRKVGETQWPDRSTSVRYRFVHALYQNALLGGLATSRRSSWSAKVADLLEARHGSHASEIAAELAVLHETAKTHDKAAMWFAVASGRARELFAYDEAESLAARGLRQVEAMVQGPERDARELEVRLALGVTSLLRRGYAAPETAHSMRRARELCAALGDAPALSSALWVLLLYLIAHGELAESEGIAEQLLRMAEQSNDQALLVAAHCSFTGLYTHMGRFEDALAHQAETDRLVTPELQKAIRRRFVPEPVLMSRAEHLRCLTILGRVHEGKLVRDALMREAELRADPRDSAFVAHFVAEFDLFLGDYESCEKISAHAVAQCEEYGIASERLWAMGYLGAARARLGHADEGIAIITSVLQILDSIECRITTPFFHAMLAGVLIRSGNPRSGLAEAQRAIAIGEQTGEHAWDGELWQLVAVARTALGEDGDGAEGAQAAAAWTTASEIASRIGAKGLTARITRAREPVG